MAADLLEIGELADFHTIAPDFPAQAPGAQCRAFPVVLDKADVMHRHIDADRLKAAQIQLLQVRRAGFDQHLILVVMLQPVGVFTIAAIGRAARRLHIGRGPGFGAQRTQRGRRVKGACADFHVIGLHHGTALAGPVALESQNDLLERARSAFGLCHVSSLWAYGAANPGFFLCNARRRVNATSRSDPRHGPVCAPIQSALAPIGTTTLAQAIHASAQHRQKWRNLHPFPPAKRSSI